MKQTVHARTMCARFSLPLMPLTVAFGNSLQLTEQRNVRQRGSERERERQKERETNIDKARDRRESEDTWSSVHLGYKLFPVSICVLTPSSKGFVLIWRVSLCVYCKFYSRLHKGGRFGFSSS